MTYLTRRTATAAILGATLGAPRLIAAEPSSLRLTKDTPIILLPYFVAHERKLWEKNGLAVAQIPSVVGMPNLIAVSGGAIDVGMSADISIAIAALSNSQIRVLGSFVRVEAMELACSKAIQTATDLPGKRIAILQGSQSHYYFSLLLKKHQIPTGSVTIVRLAPPEMVAALTSGAIDGFVWQEPFLTKAVAADPTRFHRIQEAGLIEMNACIVTNDTMVQKNRDSLRKALRTLDEAYAYINANREDAIKIGAAWSQMDPVTVADAVSRMKLSLTFDVPYMKKRLEDGAQWAIADGVAKSNATIPDFSSLFVPGPLTEARQS